MAALILIFIGNANTFDKNSFKIQVNISGEDHINLQCDFGCAWVTLTLGCESSTCEYQFDQFGMHSGNSHIEDPMLARFFIKVSKSGKKLKFNCTENCLWTDLEVRLSGEEEESILISQKGLEFN